jgi:hypothetical protein
MHKQVETKKFNIQIQVETQSSKFKYNLIAKLYRNSNKGKMKRKEGGEESRVTKQHATRDQRTKRDETIARCVNKGEMKRKEGGKESRVTKQHTTRDQRTKRDETIARCLNLQRTP